MIPRQAPWLPAPARPHLGDTEVHIWRACLEQEAETVQALSSMLAPDERSRADKFYFQKDRAHFIVARGVLRMLLARYLDIAPEQIRFTYNQYGKPALHDNDAASGLRFNVAHAHGVALYALTRGREVGLDIEFIREDFASLEIAARFFSAREVTMLGTLPAELRTHAFFNCWTRKEAYIKALGTGLAQPLDKFTVSLRPDEPAALLSTDDDAQEAARWSLVALPVATGYVAALAVEGCAPVVHYWQWLEC